MRGLAAVVCLAFLLSACAVGNSHRYDLGNAEFELDSEKSVAVSVVDLRPYVVDGDKEPKFTGLFRGGFGNPFDVTTNSGRPLAEDLTNSIVAALKRDGIDAKAVQVKAQTNEAGARSLILASQADRCSVLYVREWKSDTYFNTGLDYNLMLEVLSSDGSVIASQVVKGHDNLGPAGVPADARVAVEEAVKAKLEALFNAAEIQAAFD